MLQHIFPTPRELHKSPAKAGTHVAALRRGEWKEPGAVRTEASPELLATVREFIECG